MVLRFYLSPVVGTGTREDPYRSQIVDILGPVGINAASGIDTRADYSDLIVDHKRDQVRIGILGGLQLYHDQLSTFSWILPIGPTFTDTGSLETALDSFPDIAGDLQEQLGLPRRSLSTVRELLTRLLRTVRSSQRLRRRKLDTALTFLGSVSDRTVDSFAPGLVSRVLSELELAGYDVSTIQGTSTIGEVLEILGDQDIGPTEFSLFDFETQKPTKIYLEP